MGQKKNLRTQESRCRRYVEGAAMTPFTPLPCRIALPPGVRPVLHYEPAPDRLAQEREVIRLPVPPGMNDLPPLWGRELVFIYPRHKRRPLVADLYRGRVPLAYSIDASGDIVRGWYLLRRDYGDPAYGKTRGPLCPTQAAWLESISPAQLSVPAWAYLMPGGLPHPDLK
jgi:hypothetical protein